jgi:hypothetical protein
MNTIGRVIVIEVYHFLDPKLYKLIYLLYIKFTHLYYIKASVSTVVPRQFFFKKPLYFFRTNPHSYNLFSNIIIKEFM